MTAPFRAWPYAALAVVQWLHTAPSLFLYVVFRHPMDQTVKPPLPLWIVSVDGVPKTPASSAWLDDWTLELTVAAIPAIPADVTVEYAGPDVNLRTTWQKQWEPWGAIVATSFEIIAPGIIATWSGSIATIPPGWVLCDGNNGTPNLSNLFIRACTDPGAIGNVGGANNNTATFTGDGHTHLIVDGGPPINNYGNTHRRYPRPTNVTGTTDTFSILNKFYKLAYIMKV